MGMESMVECAAVPAWPELVGRLRSAGFPMTLRMIDGLPAFPDEEPGDDWRELRVSLPAGMVTLRREPTGVRLVTWGDVSGELVAQRDALAAALSQPAT